MLFACLFVSQAGTLMLGWLDGWLISWFCIICLIRGMGGKQFHNSCCLGFSELLAVASTDLHSIYCYMYNTWAERSCMRTQTVKPENLL